MGSIEKSFELNLKFMKWNGYDPRGFSNSFWYKIYGYTIYIVAAWIFTTLAALQPILDENLDMDRLSDTLYLLPQMIILTVKIFPFLYRKEEVEYLLERLEEYDFIPKSPEHKTIVESCNRECKRFSAFFIYSSSASWVLWATKPFYTRELLLPLEIYLPFAVTSGKLSYYAVYLYTSFCVLYGATSNSSIDCLISGLIYHASGQIKILKDNLGAVGLRADAAVARVEDEVEKRKMRNVFVSRQMRENLDHYDNVTRYVKELESVFNLTPFIQLSVSTIVICFNCFRMMLIDPMSMYFFFLVTYSMTIVCQIYMFCHYGNELNYESSSIGNAIYMSDWYTFDRDSKRMLVMLMERAKKPLLFKAGSLLPLSVGTFVSIMKTTYSLLAVLQNTK